MLIEILDAVIIMKDLMIGALEQNVRLSEVVNNHDYTSNLLRQSLCVYQEHPILFDMIEMAYYAVHPIENFKTAEYCDRMLSKN